MENISHNLALVFCCTNMENSARNAGQGVWQVREVGEKSWNLGNLSKYSGNQEIFLLEKQILQKVSTFR